MTRDESAEERAYIRAEHLRKAGLRGFDGMSEREVSEAVKSALGGISDGCPNCGWSSGPNAVLGARPIDFIGHG